jgi:integrase
LRNWINGISLSSQSKRHLYYTLKIVFDEAVLAKLIDRNPVKDFGLVKLTRKERDPFLLSDLALLFPDDTAKLLTVWGHAQYATLFMILAACGLRSGEARALCWKHILGPINGRYFLLIEQAVKFATGRRIGMTKAGKARPVYLPERARGALEWWRPYCPWSEPSDLIFPSETRGAPMGDQSLRDRLRGAMKRAGVSGEGRNLVVHSFRHGYVTRSKRAVPADLLLLMAGHADEKVQAGYVHPLLEDQLAQIGEAAGTIEAIWPKV